MKKLFVILTMLMSLTSFAQEDRFSDIDQIKGKDVYVKDNSALNVAFTIIDGKVKPVKKDKSNVTMEGKVYSVENDAYTFKKKTYVVLKGVGETILLKEEDAPLVSFFVCIQNILAGEI